MKKINKNDIVPLFLLSLILFGISSIYFDENYKKHDDEPVKNQVFNIQTFTTTSGTASGTTTTTL